ncbi:MULTISPECIES: hypothetical protein [unclassified Roseateles]|uniref:hypothetical protein n=1 Tax=unclassified Roseateles TaxID=2626991 RepID=UPI0006F45A70|nr:MULTISPECIES: hypothetical protein [unclassified Roseateles]KQW51233.1 hypothetical protein ASC81_00860 [Pelomonas sp. Root405]KRA77465.1 hypothetical protein ASD88_00860 [Pelomonas sp. Root662]
MFVSQPEYEFPFPPDLGPPGCQQWRVVELTLDAPWFLVSVEIFDAEDPGCSVTRTFCVAWDSDVVELLSTLEPDRVKGIVCMMPAWQSPTGQWTSREIREVWRCRSAAGHSVELADTAGDRFDCGLVPDHEEPIEHELVLRIAVTRTRQSSGSTTNNPLRRTNARKSGA